MASPGLDQDFKQLSKLHKLGAVTDQAYCYEINDVDGFQVDKLQNIASVTKLLTTFFASETLDLKKKYITKLYIADNKLHIEGGLDPYFEEEKMLLLVQSLNQLGYQSFSEVTFDKNFLFYDLALSQHTVITTEMIKERLSVLFSGKATPQIKKQWASVLKFAKEEGVDLDEDQIPNLLANSVKLQNLNPLLTKNPIVLTHTSLPLHRILKSMNVLSKNLVSQNIFNEASQVQTFDQLMQKIGVDKKSYIINNGSGLPIRTNATRIDNKSTCKAVLQIMKALKDSIYKHGLTLSDIIAVNGGKDLGSFRERFLKQPETHQAVISKTGTLAIASTLAGYLLIGDEIPFAILNNTAQTQSARNFQDQFISRMFHHLGQATPLDYQKVSIFPWGGENFLKTEVESLTNL
jgi:D-alanyl-D-alanine carboxypeptidase/D-alanyl-D-alanine-endopeptidase (penicillin-binding protein 4)